MFGMRGNLKKTLIKTINEFVAEYQKNLHPFVWTDYRK
jgi:hypothetical protein